MKIIFSVENMILAELRIRPQGVNCGRNFGNIALPRQPIESVDKAKLCFVFLISFPVRPCSLLDLSLVQNLVFLNSKFWGLKISTQLWGEGKYF
jgi:hypothetical protein